MAKASQGVIITRATSEVNKKYKLKYIITRTSISANGQTNIKYTYSKKIIPIKKYSYSI